MSWMCLIFMFLFFVLSHYPFSSYCCTYEYICVPHAPWFDT